MNRETMTVHKALSELKVLDSRIHKEIGDMQFVTANKHGNAKISGVPVADYIKETKSKYSSVKTLIRRRNAIKQAITNSNAVTKINIDGKEYTVAEAIDMKNYGIGYWNLILSNMEMQYNFAKSRADMENGEKLDRRADAHIQSMYEGADMKNMSDEVKKAREDFVKSQTVELIDPLNVIDEMQKMRDYIDQFTVNVDSALSVSNALTTLSIEYETV